MVEHSLFSAKITSKDENHEGFTLAREGKALVRGIFTEACFSEKEIFG